MLLSLVGCAGGWGDSRACDLAPAEAGGPTALTTVTGLDPDGTTVICGELSSAGHADGEFTGDVDRYVLSFDVPVQATVAVDSDIPSEVHAYLYGPAGEVLGTTADSGAVLPAWRPYAGGRVTLQVAGYQGRGGAYAVQVEAAPVSTSGNVAADDETACAVIDGDVRCWGEYGDELSVAGAGVRDLEIGVETVCGAGSDGVIRCWGRGGDEVLDEAYVGLAVSGYSHGHRCAWDIDGVVTCWGEESGDYLDFPGSGWSHVRVGYQATCALDPAGEITCAGPWLTPPSGAFVDLSVSQLLTCAVRAEDGTLACWYNDEQNGVAELAASVPSDRGGYSQIVVGFTYACALRGGVADCWGIEAPPSDARFTSLAGGNATVCGVRTDGAILCWGWDRMGMVSETP